MTVTAAEFAILSQSAEITCRQPVLLEDQQEGQAGFSTPNQSLLIFGEHRSASGSSDGPLEIQRPVNHQLGPRSQRPSKSLRRLKSNGSSTSRLDNNTKRHSSNLLSSKSIRAEHSLPRHLSLPDEADGKNSFSALCTCVQNQLSRKR